MFDQNIITNFDKFCTFDAFKFNFGQIHGMTNFSFL